MLWSHGLARSHEKQKSIFIQNQSGYGYKLSRMITYLDEFLPIKSHYPLTMQSYKTTWQTKTIISPIAVSMATKLARMVIYLVRLLIIKSYKTLTTWSCKVTWQNPLYLYYKSTYGKQTWQNDFAWWAPTYVTWPFDQVALWDTGFTYRRRFSTQTLKLSATCYLCNHKNWGLQILKQRAAYFDQKL